MGTMHPFSSLHPLRKRKGSQCQGILSRATKGKKVNKKENAKISIKGNSNIHAVEKK